MWIPTHEPIFPSLLHPPAQPRSLAAQDSPNTMFSTSPVWSTHLLLAVPLALMKQHAALRTLPNAAWTISVKPARLVLMPGSACRRNQTCVGESGVNFLLARPRAATERNSEPTPSFPLLSTAELIALRLPTKSNPDPALGGRVVMSAKAYLALHPRYA